MAAGNISSQPDPLAVLACAGNPRFALTGGKGAVLSVCHKLELTSCRG